MDNVVTISNVKDNVLEFNAEIQGVDTKDITMRFILEAEGMEFGFPATKIDTTKWEVAIPAMDFLKRTAYNFHIDVVTDGYHFQPLDGVVNVVGTADVYVSKPNVKVEPSASAPRTPEPEETTQKAAAPIPEPTPTVPKQASSRSIEQIANDLMAKAGKELKRKNPSDNMTAANSDKKTQKAEEKVVKAEEKKVEKADAKEEKLPSVKTLEPKTLADKHDVSVKDIEAQLKKGISHEKEHTKDEKTAREIALDHIKEDPKYYDKLDKIEEGKKKNPDAKFGKKNKVRSDTGERPAINESASEGSTASHDVQGGKPPKKDKAVKNILEALDIDTSVKPTRKRSTSTGRVQPAKMKKISAKKQIVEAEEKSGPDQPKVAAPVASAKDKAVKDILSENTNNTKEVTTSPLKKRAVVYH